ncbi:MAG: MFS transporter [Gammaproteobacteria bacterium]|nr:MFS transporter [Gammaproteobacteria bacterium]
MSGIPYLALLIGLVVQTLVTMAAYSVPVAAPAIASALAVPGERVGIFISMVYGVGVLSAVFSPSFIHRYGPVRVSQFILLAGLAMIATVSVLGTLLALAGGAVLLGLGYGATAPTSASLLMPRTPARIRNLVFSIRQIGVPLGGVLGGLVVPPLVLAQGWQLAIGVQLLPVLLTLVLLQVVRARYDVDRNPRLRIRPRGLLEPLALVKTLPEIRMLSLATFFFAGTQLCFVAFMSVHLTSHAAFGLVAAGQMLATYQISGVVSRPIWGVIADRWIPARRMLGVMGLVMAGMALLAGSFSADWSWLGIFVVSAVAGATASGYTGIAFAEFARIGGASRVAEATGLGASSQFFGVMVLPTLFSAVVSAAGYAAAYAIIAVLAGLSGLALLVIDAVRRRSSG